MEVISLTPETVDQYDKDILNTGNYKCLVKVYSPSCGHCKAMEPAWKELETSARQSGNLQGKIIELHAGVQDHFNPKFPISGYPTIVLLKEDGNVEKEYNGDRSAGSLLEFANIHMGGGSMNGGKRSKKSKKHKKNKRKTKKSKKSKRKSKKRSKKNRK